MSHPRTVMGRQSTAEFGKPNHPAVYGWRERAACRDVDSELFYRIGRTAGEKAADVAQAKAVCRRCPVTEPCLAVADDHGIWSGLTDTERHALKRRGARAKAKAAALPAPVAIGHVRAGRIAPLPGLRVRG